METLYKPIVRWTDSRPEISHKKGYGTVVQSHYNHQQMIIGCYVRGVYKNGSLHYLSLNDPRLCVDMITKDELLDDLCHLFDTGLPADLAIFGSIAGIRTLLCEMPLPELFCWVNTVLGSKCVFAEANKELARHLQKIAEERSGRCPGAEPAP